MSSDSQFTAGQEVSPGVIYVGISDTVGTDMFRLYADFDLVNYLEATDISYRIVGLDGRKGTEEHLNQNRPDSMEGASNLEKGLVYEPLQDPAKDDEGWRLPTVEEAIQISKNEDLLGHFFETGNDATGAAQAYCWTSKQTVHEARSYAGFGANFIWHAHCVDLKTGEVEILRKGEKLNLCLVYTKKRQPN